MLEKNTMENEDMGREALERDLEGKTMVVTGATSGIGRAAAAMLAARGATVIGVGRSEQRCSAAQEAILAAYPDTSLSFLLADLSSQQQVRALAAAIGARVGDNGLDVLLNNAGTVSSWYVATEDGYELQFAVNHLAPFLLTYELLPLLARTPTARIVTVSSASHRRTRIHWSDVMLRRHYNVLLAYKQSKLANVLFTLEFNRRYAAFTGIRAYAADPGLVNTEIGLKGTGGLVGWFWRRRSAGGVAPEEGARTAVFLATAPSVEGATDFYWKDCRPIAPSRYACREDEARRLWGLSELLCGIK